VKLGVYLNAQHPAGDDPGRRFAETLEQARLIRSLGFDSIWGGEHHLKWGLAGISLDPAARPEAQLRSLAANRFALGSPAQVAEALLCQHKAGVTHATMRVSWPGMRQDDILAGIELLGREVLPEVRRQTSAGRGQTVTPC